MPYPVSKAFKTDKLPHPSLVLCNYIEETFPKTKDRVVVTVSVGEETDRYSKYTIPRFQEYADKHNADFIVIRNDLYPQYPLANKFRMANLTHSKCVYFDADVWLTDDVPDFFELDGIWMHHDNGPFTDKEWAIIEGKRVAEEHGFEYRPSIMSNTGVVIFDDPSIWQAPINKFLPTHCAEQAYVEYNCYAKELTINNLPSDLNWQYWFPQWNKSNWEYGLKEARILHLASMPNDQRVQWLKNRSESCQ